MEKQNNSGGVLCTPPISVSIGDQWIILAGESGLLTCS